jgi:hypothetical protein
VSEPIFISYIVSNFNTTKLKQAGIMRFFLFFLFSFSLSTSSFSQGAKQHKLVTFSRWLKVDRLSLKLTSNLQSDEEKIKAIHSWIIHNIAFDVKKWFACDYSAVPVKKILFKRKAVGSGYSDLFYEMCQYAGITSVVLSGYSKSEYSDFGDKFYLDEHSWNAVYIDSEWRLVDACWDAGHIAYYKRTFAGYFVFAFSLGTSDRLVYRPHFSPEPSWKYFNKSGNFFITDHIPADSIWQLVTPVRSVSVMEEDSSFFLHQYSAEENPPGWRDGWQDARLKAISSTKEEKEIQSGFDFYLYNPKNNFGIAKSYLLKATKLFEAVNPLMSDKPALLVKCDSVALWLRESMRYCDSNAILLQQQKVELVGNNQKKKEITTAQNKRLLASTADALKNVNAGILIGLSGKISVKGMQQRNKMLVVKFQRNTKFEKTASGKRVHVADSSASALKIAVMEIAQKEQAETIRQNLTNLNRLHATFLQQTTAFNACVKRNTSDMKKLCDLRLRFVDDLDLDIRSLKDSLLARKFAGDSLLMMEGSGSLVKSFHSQFNDLKNDFKKLNQINQNMMTEYSKLKKSNKVNLDITDNYSKASNLYLSEMKEFSESIKGFKKKYKQFFKVSKDQLKPVQDENHGYEKEKFIELQMFSTRTSHINRHSKSRLHENKVVRGNANKLMRKLEKTRQKIEERK